MKLGWSFGLKIMWSWVWTYKYAEDTQISNNILCTYKLVNNIQQMPRMYYAYIYIYIYILRKVVCLSCRVDQISQTMAAPTTLLGTIGKCLIDEEEVGVDWDGGFCNVSRYNAKRHWTILSKWILPQKKKKKVCF
jgi:hypothetical protein